VLREGVFCSLVFAENRIKSWVLLSGVVVLKVGVESFEFVLQAIRGVVYTGLNFICSPVFALVYFVLESSIFCSLRVIYIADVRRRCCMGRCTDVLREYG
jgi:hypothetical protein